MVDRRRTPRHFDNDKPLVSARWQTIHGQRLCPGDPIADDLGHVVRMRLWMSGIAKYQDDYTPTPVASEAATDQADEAAPIQYIMTAAGKGFYTIELPGLAEPITIKGEAKATAEFERLLAERQAALDAEAANSQSENGADNQQSVADQQSEGENMSDNDTANAGAERQAADDESATGAATTTAKGDETGAGAATDEAAQGDVTTTQKGDELGAQAAAD